MLDEIKILTGEVKSFVMEEGMRDFVDKDDVLCWM